MAGWDKLRHEQYKRQLEIGIIEDEHALSPSGLPKWDELTDQQKIKLDRQMAVYAAQQDR